MTVTQAALAVPGDITTLTGGTIYDRRLLHALRDLGVNVTHITLPASFPAPTSRDMTATFQRLSSLPDTCPVIIDGLAYGALDPLRVAQIRAPIVALVHHPLAMEAGLTPARARVLHETERANLGLAAQVLVPSPHTAAILTSDYDVPATRITVARPGTDQPTAKAPQPDPPLILSVGIQMRRKGHDVLLQALNQIRDLPWQASIVGSPIDPAHAAQLHQLQTSLDLSNRVTLTGRIDRAALDVFYSTATLFALATRYEGYGIAFDEALANGLPIVSCNTGAVPETVPANAGILVPPDDPQAFANALRDVLTKPDTRQSLATAAQAAGRALPGWSDTARAAITCLSRISTSNTGAR